MKKLSILCLLLLSGCVSSDWEKIKPQVEASIKPQVEASITEVKSDLKTKITPQEAIALIKDVAKDYLSTEGQKVVTQKLLEVEANLVSKTDLDSKTKEQWTYIIGIISTIVVSYLGKQVFSAKADGHRDARLDVLMKLLLGGTNTSEPSEPTPPSDTASSVISPAEVSPVPASKPVDQNLALIQKITEGVIQSARSNPANLSMLAPLLSNLLQNTQVPPTPPATPNA